MSRPHAVFFDLDGVLVHSIEAWFQLVRHTARHFGMPDITRRQFDAGWGQGIDADLETFFVGCRGKDIEAHYAQHLLDFADQIDVTTDAAGTLRSLHDRGLPVAVITNTPTGLARDILDWAGLLRHVGLVVGAQSGLASKPAPDPLWHACDTLQVAAPDCWMVGDSRFDRQAAEAAGCPFIGYRMAHETRVDTLSEVVDLVEAEPPE
jgi:phosphoglycolate phosphatase/AHBA synthesis associated protein